MCPAACSGAGVCGGECRPGLKRCAEDGRSPQTCSDEGAWVTAVEPCETACVNGVCAGCVASKEICDGLDNDCDGTVDDAVTQVCSSACGSGTATCVGGRFGECSAPQPAPENCDGADDDCDGRVDEALTRACATACGEGLESCNEGRFQGCSAPKPSVERCDGSDDDCDGRIDEGIERRCTSACGAGVETCAMGRFEGCSAPQPKAEMCNGRDDDCDAHVDEGFLSETVMTTYSMLAMRHATCDGTQERVGPSCNAAIDRLCVARGCGRHGFGPLENTQDVVLVACATQVNTTEVAYSVLAQQHAGCNDNAKYGLACNAAVHRHCRAQGFLSGFGPVESGASAATIACVPVSSGTVVETNYPALKGRHEGCDGSAERTGRACNAAIHRMCVASGFITGFGPVENTGDQAVIVCLRS
jgi:hypothetical protein